jgi:hypothetical protein
MWVYSFKWRLRIGRRPLVKEVKSSRRAQPRKGGQSPSVRHSLGGRKRFFEEFLLESV